MPPKRTPQTLGPARGQQNKGYIAQAYDAATASENASVVRSVLMFGVSPLSFSLLCVRDGDEREKGGGKASAQEWHKDERMKGGREEGREREDWVVTLDLGLG